MSGEYIIQQCTLLRGQKYLEEAMATVEKNIDQISEPLRATAWREAFFAARDLNDRARMNYYADKVNECESLRVPAPFIEEHLRPHPQAVSTLRP